MIDLLAYTDINNSQNENKNEIMDKKHFEHSKYSKGWWEAQRTYWMKP